MPEPQGCQGEEFVFSSLGITRHRGLESHGRLGGPETQEAAEGLLQPGGALPEPKLIEMGCSAQSGDTLLRALRPHFAAGSYDLLHKNCNSFSDVALYFLVGRRLDSTYNSIEKMGVKNPSMMQRLTRGAYHPNPAALEFAVEQVLSKIKSGEAYEEEAPDSSRIVPTGTVVRVDGLKSAAAAHLNGRLGIAQHFKPETGRYVVRVGDEVKALKPDNFEPYFLHQEMCIQGLQTAIDLNGERCRICKYSTDTDRFEVRVASTGEVKALKAANLEKVQDV